MHLKNKGLTQSQDPDVERFMERFSKMALADLVIKLTRRLAEHDTLDGQSLSDRVTVHFRGLAETRGDAMPRWDPPKRRQAKARPLGDHGALKLLNAVAYNTTITVEEAAKIIGGDEDQASLAILRLVMFHRLALIEGCTPPTWKRML